jgi:hypothetical protein
VRAGRRKRAQRRERVERVELVGELDPHAAEALVLELRRLAAGAGRGGTRLRVDVVAEPRDPG